MGQGGVEPPTSRLSGGQLDTSDLGKRPGLPDKPRDLPTCVLSQIRIRPVQSTPQSTPRNDPESEPVLCLTGAHPDVNILWTYRRLKELKSQPNDHVGEAVRLHHAGFRSLRDRLNPSVDVGCVTVLVTVGQFFSERPADRPLDEAGWCMRDDETRKRRTAHGA